MLNTHFQKTEQLKVGVLLDATIRKVGKYPNSNKAGPRIIKRQKVTIRFLRFILYFFGRGQHLINNKNNWFAHYWQMAPHNSDILLYGGLLLINKFWK